MSKFAAMQEKIEERNKAIKQIVLIHLFPDESHSIQHIIKVEKGLPCKRFEKIPGIKAS